MDFIILQKPITIEKAQYEPISSFVRSIDYLLSLAASRNSSIKYKKIIKGIILLLIIKMYLLYTCGNE